MSQTLPPPLTKQLKLEIQSMQDSGIHERADELYNWLFKDKQEVFSEVLAYMGLQTDLIENLTRELADLRKEVVQEEKKFFPMSTSPSHRYR